MDLSNINNIAFLAFLTPVIAFYKQIQNFILKMGSVVIRTDTLWNSSLKYSDDFLGDILSESKIIRFGNTNWGTAGYLWIKSYNYHREVHHRFDNNLFILYKNFIPILIKNQKDANGYSFTYFYKTFNFKKYLSNLLNKQYNLKVKYFQYV